MTEKLYLANVLHSLFAALWWMIIVKKLYEKKNYSMVPCLGVQERIKAAT